LYQSSRFGLAPVDSSAATMLLREIRLSLKNVTPA
jgi:hypothetical protein